MLFDSSTVCVGSQFQEHHVLHVKPQTAHRLCIGEQSGVPLHKLLCRHLLHIVSHVVLVDCSFAAPSIDDMVKHRHLLLWIVLVTPDIGLFFVNAAVPMAMSELQSCTNHSNICIIF